MKMAAVYDIHGNYYALESVLNEMEQEHVDIVVIGGDIAWGPQPREVINLLYSKKDEFVFIMGNADREMYEQYINPKKSNHFVDKMNQWCIEQLTKEQLEWLGSFRKTYETEKILFVHGSPRSDTEAIRINTPEDEVYKMVNKVRQETIVCGHTHIQFDRKVKEKRIINAGSVGLQSRANGACWLLLNNEEAKVKVTTYDIKTASHEIMKGQCPYKEDFAEHILNPPYEGP